MIPRFVFALDYFKTIFVCLGPYGYRAPGSDYGDHVRRVNGAWGADSGDDASETSSICSERSLEVRARLELVCMSDCGLFLGCRRCLTSNAKQRMG